MKKRYKPKKFKSHLDRIIHNIALNKDQYVARPGVDFTRNRKLSMATTLRWILSMGANSLKKEIYEFCEKENIDVTSSAFIQQRMKIKVDAFRDIFQKFNQATRFKKCFHGYTILAADGSSIRMQRDPNSETYIQTSSNPEGYNQYHLNAVYDLLTRTYFDVELQPGLKVDERAALINILRRNTFNEKTIIITDRGYEGYNMFANFIETAGVDFVCRIKDGGCGALADITNLPMQELDKDIQIGITTSQTNEDKLHNRRYIPTSSKKGKKLSPKTAVRRWDYKSPYTLNIRVVRFLLDSGSYETIVTSLPRDKFSVAKIKELYHMRWGIETSFRELKYFVGLINLHGKSDQFAAQEIYAALTIYNFCECITSNVVIQNSTQKIHFYQVNYSMAFFLCRNYYKKRKQPEEKLIIDIGKYIEPVRPGRRDKRKLRQKTFTGFVYRIAA